MSKLAIFLDDEKAVEIIRMVIENEKCIDGRWRGKKCRKRNGVYKVNAKDLVAEIVKDWYEKIYSKRFDSGLDIEEVFEKEFEEFKKVLEEAKRVVDNG
ncbi:hypothetical protein [Desulfurobacterium sp.]|uniref:hypothetical protein n=1 Tax=Desulfurobacterium sp. TaxID=2004706 RepID=UPI00260F3FB8|nr:hypothetical protein [Desulfurobacterium sp.]